MPADVGRMKKKSRANSRESRCLHLRPQANVHERRIATLSCMRKNLVIQDESMRSDKSDTGYRNINEYEEFVLMDFCTT